MRLFGSALFLAAILAPATFAQDATALFRKAPPEIEEALRTTTRAFFDLQVEKKYGASIKYVAEDSIDAYIASEKSCLSIEPLNITYNDAFTEATVAVLCGQSFATTGGGGRVTMPMTTYWRREGDDWKWIVPKVERSTKGDYMMTPFGPIPIEPRDKPDAAEGSGKSPDKIVPKVSIADVKAPLRTNPAVVVMPADRPSTVTAEVLNSFPGLLKLAVRWVGLKGLTATVDKDELNSDEIATVTISYEPQGIMPPPKKHAVWIETTPMRSATPIEIEFRYSDEIKAAGAEKNGG